MMSGGTGERDAVDRAAVLDVVAALQRWRGVRVEVSVSEGRVGFSMARFAGVLRNVEFEDGDDRVVVDLGDDAAVVVFGDLLDRAPSIEDSAISCVYAGGLLVLRRATS